MGISIAAFLLYAFIFLVVFIIGIVITRAIFSIPQQLKYNRASVKLLALIDKKLGGDSQSIREIVYESNENFKNDPHFKQLSEKKPAE